jgi:hypothetical protein
MQAECRHVGELHTVQNAPLYAALIKYKLKLNVNLKYYALVYNFD